jgi:hypothetical protein
MHIKKNRLSLSRVSLGQLSGGFLLRPGPVPCPGRPAGPVRVSKLCQGHITFLEKVIYLNTIFIMTMKLFAFHLLNLSSCKFFVFEIVVTVTFQSDFFSEKYQNNIFLILLKIIFDISTSKWSKNTKKY